MKSATSVNLWKILLSISPIVENKLFSLLSDSEKSAANRFKFAQHRRRYIAAHGAMREILSRELGMAVEQLALSEQGQGKPFVLGNPLYFNLSHSEEMAVLAISQDGEVGVDVEWINPKIQGLALAKRFFHPQEYEQMLQVPADQQLAFFYHCWTAKEAYLKAKGLGIANHLQGFALDLQDFCKPKILWTAPELADFAHWRVQMLQLSEDYVCAVVGTVGQSQVMLREYSQ